LGHRLKFGGAAGIGRSAPDICRARSSRKDNRKGEGIAAKGVGSPQAILDAQRVILGAVIAQTGGRAF